ncbi:MAG: hypothetical protein NT120_02650, partial [Candidatus Aenigmarchaeota archaeon]|nr:hypothetical protein [Candidatus Aenigmarchaeota archaeon]
LEKKMTNLEEVTNKKLQMMEGSFSAMKNMLEEMKKENENLKKDRHFLLDKIKTYIIDEESIKKQAEKNISGGKKEETYEKGVQEHYTGKAEPIKEEKKEEKHAEVERNMQTPLDALLDLVMKRGKLNFAEAAKNFHVKEKQIEEWARILEDHNLIEMHYPAMGKPVMKKISVV